MEDMDIASKPVAAAPLGKESAASSDAARFIESLAKECDKMTPILAEQLHRKQHAANARRARQFDSGYNRPATHHLAQEDGYDWHHSAQNQDKLLYTAQRRMQSAVDCTPWSTVPCEHSPCTSGRAEPSSSCYLAGTVPRTREAALYAASRREAKHAMAPPTCTPAVPRAELVTRSRHPTAAYLAQRTCDAFNA